VYRTFNENPKTTRRSMQAPSFQDAMAAAGFTVDGLIADGEVAPCIAALIASILNYPTT
jgi:hypothetical protein